jgi:hypothetical protein
MNNALARTSVRLHYFHRSIDQLQTPFGTLSEMANQESNSIFPKCWPTC